MINYEKCLAMFFIIRNNAKNKKDIINFENNLNQNIFEILYSLKNKKYKFDKYRIFLIRDPKYRLIMSENIKDKIVNHMVSEYILRPALEPALIDSNVATRKFKGTGYALKIFTKYVNKLMYFGEEIYVLKIDIKKYFYNIDHKILIKMIEKKINDYDAIQIIKTIIETTNEPYINKEIELLKKNEINRIKKLKINEYEKNKKISEVLSIPFYIANKGLPIGNMTSQILAIYYLNEIDHYIKEDLKIKYYIRYMDDLIMLSTDKKHLKLYYKKICDKLNEFELEINNKSNIYKLSNGVSFLGYTFKSNGNLTIRYNNKTIKRIRKKIKYLYKYDYEKYKKSFASYKGYFNFCNTSLKEEVINFEK